MEEDEEKSDDSSDHHGGINNTDGNSKQEYSCASEFDPEVPGIQRFQETGSNSEQKSGTGAESTAFSC